MKLPMSAVLPAAPSGAVRAAAPVLPRRRIAAIDALRGLTFVVMLFVNALAGAGGIPYGIGHMAAGVDGMSLADVVFPAFLFVVGTSIPFSLNARLAQAGGVRGALPQVLARALGLIVLGLFMVNAEEGYNEAAMGVSIATWELCFYGAVLLVWGAWRLPERARERALRAAGIIAIVVLALVYRSGPDGQGWMDTAWWGILGCIGWAYLLASLVYLAGRGRVVVLAAALAACVAWYAVSRATGGNEVLAMHATHTSIVLCGVLAALLLFDERRVATPAARLARGLVLAAALALAAWLLHRAYPISKIGATPPWALYCGALCTIVLLALVWIVEVRGVQRWTALVQPAAANPLVTYLLPVVLGAVMHLLHLQWWPALRHGAGALAFSFLFACATVAVVALLNLYHFKLRL